MSRFVPRVSLPSLLLFRPVSRARREVGSGEPGWPVYPSRVYPSLMFIVHSQGWATGWLASDTFVLRSTVYGRDPPPRLVGSLSMGLV